MTEPAPTSGMESSSGRDTPGCPEPVPARAGLLQRRDHLLLVSAWSLAVGATIQWLAVAILLRPGYDSHAYWLAWRGPMYDGAPNTADAYLYSPAFAQVLRPLTLLPWPAFAVLWSLLLLGVLWWLLRPLPSRWALPLGIAALNEVVAGNVFLIVAAVVVVGFAAPEAWAFVALTKVTACLGPVWFLARREWLRLARAVGATAAVIAVSYVLSPELWHQWLQLLADGMHSTTSPTGSPISPPLVVRLPLALAVTVWGAVTGRRWALAAAVCLASPVIGVGTLTILLAIPRLESRRGAGPR